MRSTWATPYKFNGKEKDEETGLYYYGASYYKQRLQLQTMKVHNKIISLENPLCCSFVSSPKEWKFKVNI